MADVSRPKTNHGGKPKPARASCVEPSSSSHQIEVEPLDPKLKARDRVLPLALLFCFAFLIRAGILVKNGGALQADPDAYQAIAITLSDQGVFGLTAPDGRVIPTSFRPPLYPAILSLLVAEGSGPHLFLIGCFHLLIGLLTVLFTYLAAQSITSPTLNHLTKHRIGLLAGCITTLDPILVQQSTFAMTETLAAFLASMIFWHWMKNRTGDSTPWRVGLTGGILLSLAYLCRPTFLVWAFLLLAHDFLEAVLASTRRSGQADRSVEWKKRQITQTLLSATLVLLAVGLWTVRNQRATGHPVWATTHGGYTLLLGNNPIFYEHLENHGMLTRWNAAEFTRAYTFRFGEDGTDPEFWLATRDQKMEPNLPDPNLTEHQDDQWSYAAAKAAIANTPSTFVKACLNRIYRLWTPIPFSTPDRSDVQRIVISIYYLGIYLAAIFGLFKRLKTVNWRAYWPAISLVISLSVVHTFYWSNMRMRAPALPLIAIFAAQVYRPKFTKKIQQQ